jgi:hypothetical protein
MVRAFFSLQVDDRYLLGNDQLYRNPDLVSENPEYAWGTAFWFWAVNVHPQLTGASKGQFGAALMAINGALEWYVFIVV